MRSEKEHSLALELSQLGWSDVQIGKLTGIPRSTVRDWRRAKLVGSSGRTPYSTGPPEDCPRCHSRWLDEPNYSYLLGLYLGDGCLSRQSSNSWKLRIVQDAKYRNLVQECGRSMAAIRGHDRITFQDREGCVEISSSWRHWLCLFPQHATGQKNQRQIWLEPWQDCLVNREPRQFVRGLIHSDGCRYINEVTMPVADGPKVYRYQSYSFTNTSPDILDMLSASLDRLDVRHRRYERIIAITRREAVHILDGFVGPKS